MNDASHADTSFDRLIRTPPQRQADAIEDDVVVRPTPALDRWGITIGAAVTVGAFVVLWPFSALLRPNPDMFIVVLFAIFGTLPAAAVAIADTLLVGVPLVLLAQRLLRDVASPIAHAVVHAGLGAIAAVVPLAIWLALVVGELLEPWQGFGVHLGFALPLIGCTMLSSLLGWLAGWRATVAARKRTTADGFRRLGLAGSGRR